LYRLRCRATLGRIRARLSATRRAQEEEELALAWWGRAAARQALWAWTREAHLARERDVVLILRLRRAREEGARRTVYLAWMDWVEGKRCRRKTQAAVALLYRRRTLQQALRAWGAETRLMIRSRLLQERRRRAALGHSLCLWALGAAKATQRRLRLERGLFRRWRSALTRSRRHREREGLAWRWWSHRGRMRAMNRLKDRVRGARLEARLRLSAELTRRRTTLAEALKRWTRLLVQRRQEAELLGCHVRWATRTAVARWRMAMAQRRLQACTEGLATGLKRRRDLVRVCRARAC
jgi:hypothetical protein